MLKRSTDGLVPFIRIPPGLPGLHGICGNQLGNRELPVRLKSQEHRDRSHLLAPYALDLTAHLPQVCPNHQRDRDQADDGGRRQLAHPATEAEPCHRANPPLSP
ncbi:hypothetical protein SDC9_122879 [bioreactor metagenome]|uniref:Uncharacterized protein n=1 Tax=bioreactor metagenome TaxID=1076179 RepID=A0A645CG56_9ZZZZ